MRRILWLLRLAALNLLRNHRRNFVTGIALASSFAGILLFTGYVVWVEKYLRASTVFLNQAGHLVIARPQGLEQQLTKPKAALLRTEEQTKIESMLLGDPHILMTGKGLQSLILVVKDCRSRGVLAIGRDSAVDAQNLHHPDVLRWNSELLHPAHVPALAAFKLKAPQEAAVFPSPILERFTNRVVANPEQGCETSAPGSLQLVGRTRDGMINAMDGQSLGAQSTGLAILDERSIYMPTSDLQQLLATDEVGSYSIYLKSVLDLPLVWWRLNSAVKASGLNLEVLPFFSEDVGLYYIGTMAFLGAVASFFVLLVTSVVGLSLFSLFSMAVTERSMEMGLLLSLGFKRNVVACLFVLESLMLCLLSLALGLLAALGIGDLIYRQNIRFAPPGIAGDTHFTIAWEPSVMGLIALCFLLATFVSIRIVVALKLRGSTISLLQNSATL